MESQHERYTPFAKQDRQEIAQAALRCSSGWRRGTLMLIRPGPSVAAKSRAGTNRINTGSRKQETGMKINCIRDWLVRERGGRCVFACCSTGISNGPGHSPQRVPTKLLMLFIPGCCYLSSTSSNSSSHTVLLQTSAPAWR